MRACIRLLSDLYACIKKLSSSAREAAAHGDVDAAAAEHAVARNFGGKSTELHRVLVQFHSHRLHASDPHGLTQGMVEVEVALRHQASDGRLLTSGFLRLSCRGLHHQSIVRRGAVIEYVAHGHGCVVDPEEHPTADGDAPLRPCDLIYPGDVLIGVQCTTCSDLTEAWKEQVESPYEVRHAVASARACAQEPHGVRVPPARV